MPNKTHRAPLRYKIPDFFSSLLGNGPGLWAALIVFLGLLALGNIGLIIMIWRAFKELKIND